MIFIISQHTKIKAEIWDCPGNNGTSDHPDYNFLLCCVCVFVSLWLQWLGGSVMIMSWTLQHFMHVSACGTASSSSWEESSTSACLLSFSKGQTHTYKYTYSCRLHCLKTEIILLMFLTHRSIEEVIALFISIAFVADAVKGTVKSECYPYTHTYTQPN